MDADLNVDVVGREFVRQYYTVLNQRPDCLHQFFTKDSSFIHGGVEKPGEEKPAYRGQAVIHEKILSLNFRDCHTKIRQVDCQKTVGNAVLVQVSGEFSTNGQPMRRFMQSFVLVQQTPKNFYVHNDIFRYQDEVFHDYVGGTDDVSVAEEEENMAAKEEKPGVENDLKSSLEAKDAHHITDSIPTSYHGARDLIGSQDHPSPPVAAVVANQAKLEPVAQLLNNDHDHLVGETQQLNGHADGVTSDGDSPIVAVVEQLIKSEHATPLEVTTVASVNTSPAAGELKADDEKLAKVTTEQPQAQQQQQQTVQQQQQQQQPAAPKVFSWASLASKNTTPSSNLSTPPQKPQATIKPERKAEAIAPQQQHQQQQQQQQHTISNGVNGSARQQQQQPQQKFPQSSEKKWSSESTPPSSLPPSSSATEDSGVKPPSFIPDNQQLFIGNLPHAITEQEIKELFEKFGPVIDIKINRKGASRDLPNFGFVAFDNHEAVTKAMKAKPIMLHGKRRINIEEKKDQSGGGGGGGARRPPMRGKGTTVVVNKSGTSGGGRVGSGSGSGGNFNSHDDDH